ncbi:hypothetical protein ACLI09_09285 [Flavobacterium sp. RHBU_24]|uniref:hypothetical protein n=1 Tax=Flavobacterium sp. RHBU_24 TaxID=3391185 RepID=UPI0039855A02
MFKVDYSYRKFIIVKGILVFSIASIALIGWFFNIDILKSVLHGASPMKFYTAIGLLTSAVSLVLQVSKKQIIKIAGRIIALIPYYFYGISHSNIFFSHIHSCVICKL